MKISIVTACYKSSATIRDALESVRSQRRPEGVALEHVIVDGGSDDGTVDVIGAFERRPRPYDFRWISEKDRGMYDAINKGIRMATGEVVGILNADDWLDGEDVIARIVLLRLHGQGRQSGERDGGDEEADGGDDHGVRGRDAAADGECGRSAEGA